MSRRSAPSSFDYESSCCAGQAYARTFDAANRIGYAVDAGSAMTYTYDAIGNFVELMPSGKAAANPGGVMRYDHDRRSLL